jgi:hypothetical protein
MMITRDVVIFILVTCLLLIIVEGLSSAAIASFQMLQDDTPHEVSQYDEYLGWTGIPNTYIPDMYGPGKFVRTNLRGFRNEDEFEITEPASKIRIICSGDSFTYGQGVANNDTWCHLITEHNDRLETVNMALPGYGVDQMYLRYLRDGTGIEHSIHIFAFIVGDLVRMAFKDQHEYGKPVMRIDEGALVVDNVPVPRWRWAISRLLSRADFRVVDIAKRVTKRWEQHEAGTPSTIVRIGPVALKIFESIRQKCAAMNVVPVFVFLPTESDLRKEHSWHRWVIANMDALDLSFVDLTPALLAVPTGRAASFFIAPGEQAAGHYTEAGNKWAAGVLYESLMAIPQIKAQLAEK